MNKLMKAAAVAGLALASLTACSTAQTQQPTPTECKLNLGMVTDVGGIDDKSFNEGTYNGLVRYANDNGLGKDCYKYLQSAADADYIPNLSQFAEEKLDLIVAPGFLFAESMATVADQFPDSKFVIIDSVVEKPNVASAVFAEQEPSYLVGIAAAMKAKEAGKDTVGYIGGMDFDVIQRFEAGFEEGVASVDPSIKVLVDYANSFTDSTIGGQLAQKQFNAGAYVVFHAAGATGNGLIAEAKARREAGEDVWAIGVDVDQYEAGKMADGKSAILTSALKRVDVASYTFIEKVAKGTFTSETILFNAQNDGIGIPAENPNLSKEISDAVNAALAKIKSGEIVVGVTPARLK